MKNSQKEAWLNFEADQWLDRNKEVLTNFDANTDPVLRVMNDYQIAPDSCIEIGSSFGYRLHHLKQEFVNCKAVGVDPSSEAIEKGRSLFPEIDLCRGTSDDLSIFEDATFDLVICGFFLYVTDRKLLLKTVAEIDRVLKDGGRLIIYDFFSKKPTGNAYHHIKTFDAYSYKQNYEDIFLASGLYHLLHKETIHHATLKKDKSDNFNDKACITALIKNTHAIYE